MRDRRRALAHQEESAMTHHRVLVLGLLVAAIVTPGLSSEPVTLAGLKDQAATDEATPEGKTYLKLFRTNPLMLALDAAEDQCRDAAMRSGPKEEFVIALRIGANGYPTDALVSPDDEGMRCFADRLKATGFIKPPYDGFAIYMDFVHTEPGTEGRQSQ
jgi:hypothetical protein